MTILEYRAAFPHLFCPGQVWYEEEAFASLDLTPITVKPTLFVPWPEQVQPDELTDAVLLVGLYIQDTTDPMFANYLLTGSTDAEGQEVFVGGTRNGRGLEIHRIVRHANRLTTPLWH